MPAVVVVVATVAVMIRYLEKVGVVKELIHQITPLMEAQLQQIQVVEVVVLLEMQVLLVEQVVQV